MSESEKTGGKWVSCVDLTEAGKYECSYCSTPMVQLSVDRVGEGPFVESETGIVHTEVRCLRVQMRAKTVNVKSLMEREAALKVQVDARDQSFADIHAECDRAGVRRENVTGVASPATDRVRWLASDLRDARSVTSSILQLIAITCDEAEVPASKDEAVRLESLVDALKAARAGCDDSVRRFHDEVQAECDAAGITESAKTINRVSWMRGRLDDAHAEEVRLRTELAAALSTIASLTKSRDHLQVGLNQAHRECDQANVDGCGWDLVSRVRRLRERCDELRVERDRAISDRDAHRARLNEIAFERIEEAKKVAGLRSELEEAKARLAHIANVLPHWAVERIGESLGRVQAKSGDEADDGTEQPTFADLTAKVVYLEQSRGSQRAKIVERDERIRELQQGKLDADVATHEVAAERDQLRADLSAANVALKVANEAIDVLTRERDLGRVAYAERDMVIKERDVAVAERDQLCADLSRDRDLATNMLARVEAQCDHAFKIVGENALAATASDPTDMRVAFLGEACRVAYMERDAAHQAVSRVEAACDGAFESATSDVAERVSLLSAAWRTVRDERDVALSERREVFKERAAYDRALSETKKTLASSFDYMGEGHTLDYENANALDYARAVREVFHRMDGKLREMTIARDKLLADRDEATRAYRQAKSERDVARESYEAAITARDEAQHSVRLLGAGLETRTRERDEAVRAWRDECAKLEARTQERDVAIKERNEATSRLKLLDVAAAISERDEAIKERDVARKQRDEMCEEVGNAKDTCEYIHSVCDEADIARRLQNGFAASARQRVNWLAAAYRQAAEAGTAVEAFKERDAAVKERDVAFKERDEARARINEACDEVAKAIHNVCDEAGVGRDFVETGFAASARQRVGWLAAAQRQAADSAAAAYKVRDEALKKCVEEATEFRRVERAQGVQLMKDTFADIHSVCDAAGIAKNAPDSPAASASVRVKWLAKELGLEQDRACGYVRQRDTAIKEREVAVKQRAEACAERDEARTRLNVERDNAEYAVKGRDEALEQCKLLTRQRDEVIHQRDEARRERDESFAECDRVKHACIMERMSRDVAIKERDEAYKARDEAAKALDTRRHEFSIELDLLNKRRDALVGERDAVLKKCKALEGELEVVDRQRGEAVRQLDAALVEATEARERGRKESDKEDFRVKVVRVEAERDEAIKERDGAVFVRDEAIKERDWAIKQRDLAVRASDRAVREHAAVATAYGAVMEERNEEMRLRKDAFGRRDEAISHRDGALKQRFEAIQQRDMAVKERDTAIKERDEAQWVATTKAMVERLVTPEPGSAPQWGWWTWSTGSTGGTVVSLKVGPAGHRVELTAEQALEIVRTAPKFAGPWEKDLEIGWYRRGAFSPLRSSDRIASVVAGWTVKNDDGSPHHDVKYPHLVLWDVENKDGAVPSKITDFEVGKNAVDAHLTRKGWVFVSAEALEAYGVDKSRGK